MSATFTDQVIRNGKNHIKLSLSSHYKRTAAFSP